MMTVSTAMEKRPGLAGSTATSDVARCFFVAVTVAVSLLVLSRVEAAEMQPPLQMLRHPDFTLIVAERVESLEMPRQMRVKVLQTLRGADVEEEEIDLWVNDGDEDALKLGVRYLVFFNDVERASLKPRTRVRNPQRRQLVSVDGADPAVFEDSPYSRKLLSTEHRSGEASAEYRNVVIRGLRSRDQKFVDLWSAELVFRPATFDLLGKREVALIDRVSGDRKQRAATRARLLLAALDRHPNYGKGWYVNRARSILKHYVPGELAENPGLGELVYSALLIVQRYPSRALATELSNWLQATPAIAENAALALRSIDPTVERKALGTAIASQKTSEATRVMLDGLLRRLDGGQSDPATGDVPE